jgi:hypothetical protein
VTLNIGPDFSLPVDAVTSTFGILAKRRVGKSNAAVVMAEEMYDAGLPWVAVDPKGDWWGIRAAGDGKAPGLSVLVFGGEHGDVPLEPTGGRLVADLVVQRRLTCVLDVSAMTKADQRRFLLDFAEQLYAKNREPLHVFCEEADEYIPQMVRGEDAKLVRAFEVLVKRGGFRGIGATLITQRSASLNNDVLTQIETLIVLRTTGTPDRKAIRDWVVYHEAGLEAVKEVPKLPTGTAWVFSPETDVMRKVAFRRRRTFDSGATPKVGQKVRPPAKLAAVDLDEIRGAMADTIERAKADDPKHLKARIRDLEKEVARAVADRPEPVQVEIPAISAEDLERLEAATTELAAQGTAVTTIAEALRLQLAELRPVAGGKGLPAAAKEGRASQRGRSAAAHARTPGERLTPGTATTRKSAGARPETRPVTPADAPDLKAGARRMIEALGRMHPLYVTKSQWGTVAKLKSTGGTWSTYVSAIRQHGFLEETPAGYRLTEAGLDYLGGAPEPMTAAELQDQYRRILRAGAAKMLDGLIDAYPNGLTREELGAAADVVTTGGTFSTYLSDLVRNGLAERQGDHVIATEVLIHGADL